MDNQHEFTTEYQGISGIYFMKLLETIISIGNLDKDGLNILDYGAGYGILKRILSKDGVKVNVVNYDIEPDLTDIDDWHDANFDTIVANEVFYTFDAIQLEHLLTEFRQKNIKAELIVGISKQSFLNNFGKVVFGQSDAHKSTKLKPKDELSILSKHMDIIDHKSVWFLADVYKLRFKSIPA